MRNIEEMTRDAERLEALTGQALPVSRLFQPFEEQLNRPDLKIDWSLAARCLRREGGYVPAAVRLYLKSI